MAFKSSNFLVNGLVLLVMISSILISTSVSAQQPERTSQYSDEELVEFIFVAQKVMPLQQESQMKMIEEIEENDLTVDKFNNILESKTTGAETDATEEELVAFNNAVENIQLLQEQYMEMISEVILVEGMSPEKYEEIIFNYQMDPQLQMRVNQLMDELNEQPEQ